MITSAKNYSIANSTLPNVSESLLDSFQKITFVLITKSTVNFVNVEQKRAINTEGLVFPLSPQDLKIYPIGLRKWIWKHVFALPELVLSLDDIVQYEGMKFRVMAKNDYTQYGAVEYHLCQDYR